MRLLLVAMLLSLGLIGSNESRAGMMVVPERPALYAGFDNKVAGQLIDSRGPTYGEPENLGNLDADVVEISPGQNLLRVSNDLSSSGTRRMHWPMMGNAEISEGVVKISFDLTLSALDKYSVLIRESVSSSRSFMSIAFNPTGQIYVSDAAGNIAQFTYVVNVPLHFELTFDMDTVKSSLTVNGSSFFAGRSFGITDRGVGRILIGYASGSSGSSFDLDNLKISGPLPFPVALEANFEDKAVGLPIGDGGAVAHEPMSISPDMDAIVVEAAPGVNILDMASTNTSGTQVARWQFVDNLEVRTGLYVLDFDMAMETRDRYRVALRERTSSSQTFMNLQFQQNGTIAVSDANGTELFVGVDYDAGRVYQYRVIFDLDAGLYDIFRDGEPLIRERAHGITERGIGGTLFSVDNGAQASAHLQIDSLRVSLSKGAGISSDLEFLQEATTAIENQPVTPAIKVGVVNILDQPVPDGTLVTLEIASGSGPPGATLGGSDATTTAGIATFSALTFDTPGTYFVVARSLDAAKIGNVEIVVAQSDVLFANGFEFSGGN